MDARSRSPINEKARVASKFDTHRGHDDELLVVQCVDASSTR